jgi:hypothetical protein
MVEMQILQEQYICHHIRSFELMTLRGQDTGRQVHDSEIHYIYQGAKFPCLEGCPEVIELPHLSVGEYLERQETDGFEKAQDTYLELMQNLADMAFEFFLDTGLAASGDTKTLAIWDSMGKESPNELAIRIGHEWMDCLRIPEISDDCLIFGTTRATPR